MKRLFCAIILTTACVVSVFGQQQDSLATSQLYNRIMSLDEEIRNNPSKQTDNFNPSDSASLPIGIVREIGNTKYIVCIDSAYFTPEGAFFNVYMALDFPRADKKIAFAAKGIQFNPKGVSVANGAKLQLVSEQVINLGPKHQLVFKDNGQNYVEFDCNGYSQTSLSVDFVLGKGSLENASNPELPVKASMALVVQDLTNITFQLNDITPFKLKGAKDFVFHLQNVVIDQSDVVTPQGVVLPPQTAQLYPGGTQAWRGFYAANATVTLPQKLSEPNQPPTEIYAQHLIIDDAGLSGSFGANNVLSLGDGETAGGWGFSITNIQVDIASNHITGGSLSGEIEVTPLDDRAFSYTAAVTENPNENKLDYLFTVSPSGPVALAGFKSTLTLNPSSSFTIQSVGDQFVPSATLNGNWMLDFEKARFSGIEFQNVQIGTTAPYITNGYFSLAPLQDSSRVVGFNIGINSVGITQTPQGELAFTVGVGMNMGEEPVTFGASTTVRLITERQTNNQGRTHFMFDRLAVDDIAFNISTTPFNLQGVVSVREDDPVFGDLFYGSISLNLKNVLDAPIMVSAGFGKMNNYKYWFTDASIPVNIPIVPSLKITGLYGGVQNRVANTQTEAQMLNRVAGQIIPPGNTAVIPFVPDANQGMVFRAGVAIQGTTEKVMNGETMLTVAFNPNGGLQSVNFLGQVYMMVDRNQRSSNNVKKVWGDISVNYDNVNKVFDAGVNAAIIVPGKLTGGLNIALHVDQNDWYFWLNNPSNRANLNLVDIFYVNTYFMIGTQIMPIPPPPSYITNMVGAGSIGSIDLAAVGNGNGFATGMEFGTNFGGEFPKETDWRGFVNVSVAGGFDVMLTNVQNAHCSGSTDPVGVNGFYAMGQVYAYLNGGFGVRKYQQGQNGMQVQNEYTVGSLQIAALLQGKLPKPTFVYGAIGIQANVLGIINFGFTADVEFGTNCTLVGS